MKMASNSNNIKVINRGLMIIVAILAFGYIGMGAAIYSLTQGITVHLPPDLSKSVSVKANQHSKTTVYSFANYMYQYLNTWQNGDIDYQNRIKNTAFYITSAFRSELLRDLEKLKNRNGINELAGRSRSLNIEDNFHFDNSSVEVLGDSQWRVILKYKISEYVGKTRVKDSLINVPLYVVKSNSDPASNQWGLKISSFAGPIQRITELSK